MNCKQGDLAIVVISYNNNHGKIVHCLEPILHEFADSGFTNSWITEPMLFDRFGNEVPVPDANIRPIRDQDGQDETLTWLDVPSKEIA